MALGAFAVISGLAVAAGNGNPLVAVAPVLAVVGGLILFHAPLRTTVLGVLFLVMVVDYLPEGPQSGLWQSPLFPIAMALFLNLSATTGIGFLRFPGLDVLLLLLLALAIYRRATGSKIDPPATPSVRVLNHLLFLSWLTLMIWEGYGVSQGGDFNESLWQIRQLLLFPLMTFLFLQAFSGTVAEFKLVAKVFIVAAVFKSIIGIYFLYFIVRPMGVVVEFTTSHSDTLMFVPLLAMQIALLFERPSLSNWKRAGLWVPIVVWGMIANDRRLAYVSLAGSFMCIFLMNPWKGPKRSVARTLLLASPLIIAYVAAGWNSRNPVFGGAQLVKSLIKGDQAQAGADYRDIENFDLLATWSNNKFMGTGFGHKFEEPVKLPDISFAMPTYQYHPHDSILWLWGILGIFGFSGIFAPIVGGVFVAARAYHKSTNVYDRVMAMTAICMVITHINQCFGDMGTRTYFGSLLTGLCLALASKLAMRVGAWPRKKPL